MKDFFERGFLATVGVLTISREKTQEMVDEMVKRGEMSREEGRQLVERMVQRGQEEQETLRNLVRQEVQKAMGELDLATRSDLNALEAKLDQVLQKLDSGAQ